MTSSTRDVRLRRVLTCLFCLVVLVQAAPSGSNSTNDGQNESDGDTPPQAAVMKLSTTPLERSMQPLFGITNFFLDKMIQPDEQGPEVLFDFATAFMQSNVSISQYPFQQELPRIFKYYNGFLVCLLIGLIFIVLMPIVGMFFCCCRLCGNCGGRADRMDPKSARCKRVTYTVLLAIFTTIMLFGVVCAFVTNNLLFAQVTDVQRGYASRVNHSLNIVDTYVKDTARELKTNPAKLTSDGIDKITSQLKQSPQRLFDKISSFTGAGLLLNMSVTLSDDIPKLKTEIQTYNEVLTTAKADGIQLTDALNAVKIDINTGLQGCAMAECAAAISKLDQLIIGIDLDKLPNFQQAEIVLDQFIPSLQTMANGARDDFQKLGLSFSQNGIDDATLQLNAIKAKIDSPMNELGDAITNVSEPIKMVRQNMENIQRISELNIIGYVGVILSCFFLLIVLLLFMGMMFGVCGERPYEDARFCNSGVGGHFLMSSTGFMFLFSALLMLITSALFIVGAPLHTEVCRNVLQPLNSTFIRRLNDNFNLGPFLYAGQSQEKLTILDVLSGCENNQTLYKALQLNRVTDIDSIVDGSKKEAENYIQQAMATFTFPDNLKVLPDNLILELNKLNTAQNLKQDFSIALAELEKPLTIDLIAYSTELIRLGINSMELNAAITKLRSLASNETLSLNMQIEDLKLRLELIERINSISSDTDFIIKEAEKVALEFDTANIATTMKLSETFVIQPMLDQLTETANGISNLIANKIGVCRPLYDSYFIIVGATCNGVLDPFNGFWFVLGTMLILFIPSIIFAVKLTGLYRKTENYVGHSFDVALIASKVYPGDHIPLDDIRIKRAKVPSAAAGGGNVNLASSSTSIASAPEHDPGDQRRLIK